MANTPRRTRYSGSPVPSQAPSQSDPYSPEFQPDLAVTEDMRGVKPIGFPPTGAFTVSVYDARPVQAISVEKQFRTVSGEQNFLDERAAVAISTALGRWTMTVPQSRIFVLKEIQFSVEFPNNMGETVDLYNAFGFPSDRLITANPRLALLVNGAPIDEWGDLRLADNLFGKNRLSLYTLIPGGQDFTFQFSVRVEGVSTDNFIIYGSVYGDYLLAKGTSLPVEPVNSEALPVRSGGFNEGELYGSLGKRGSNQ